MVLKPEGQKIKKIKKTYKWKLCANINAGCDIKKWHSSS